jgi:hypothetical protein
MISTTFLRNTSSSTGHPLNMKSKAVQKTKYQNINFSGGKEKNKTLALITKIALLMIGFVILASVHPFGSGSKHIDNTMNQLIQKQAEVPDYIHHLMEPGMMCLPNCLNGYLINKKNFSYKRDANVVSYAALEALKDPDKSSKIYNSPSDNGVVVEKQVIEKDEEPYVLETVLYINPERMAFHRSAFKFLYEWLVLPNNFETLSESIILENIKRTYSLIISGSIEREFRKNEKIIFDEDSSHLFNPDGIQKLLKEKGGSKEELEIYLESTEKMNQFYDINEGILNLTQREKQVWSKFCYFPPSSKEIPKKMKELAKTFKQMLIWLDKGQADPVLVGSGIHREILKIRPGSQGNGRLARALMNAIFLRAKLDPVVFPDKEEYKAKLREEFKVPGTFVMYIENTIMPWIKKNLHGLNLNDVKIIEEWMLEALREDRG